MCGSTFIQLKKKKTDQKVNHLCKLRQLGKQGGLPYAKGVRVCIFTQK